MPLRISNKHRGQIDFNANTVTHPQLFAHCNDTPYIMEMSVIPSNCLDDTQQLNLFQVNILALQMPNMIKLTWSVSNPLTASKLSTWGTGQRFMACCYANGNLQFVKIDKDPYVLQFQRTSLANFIDASTICLKTSAAPHQALPYNQHQMHTSKSLNKMHKLLKCRGMFVRIMRSGGTFATSLVYKGVQQIHNIKYNKKILHG